jgi:hypothetical protein
MTEPKLRTSIVRGLMLRRLLIDFSTAEGCFAPRRIISISSRL